MKYFLIEEWDNDYNCRTRTFALQARCHEDAREIARCHSSSAYDYMVHSEVSDSVASSFPKLGDI
jgi:hypothetical protein